MELGWPRARVSPLGLGSPAETWENGPRKDGQTPGRGEAPLKAAKRRSTFQTLRGLWAIHEGAGKAGRGEMRSLFTAS